MTITELITIGNTFEWNYPQMKFADDTVLDVVSEEKIVSNEQDYISWLYKVKRLFQKEYSTDIMFDEIIELTSSHESITYSRHCRIMGILGCVEDEPLLCNKPVQTNSAPAVEVTNNINIGITLSSITEGLTPEQLKELKDYIQSNPQDKEGFMKKLLSYGADVTTILTNVLGTEPIWNAIKNLFS